MENIAIEIQALIIADISGILTTEEKVYLDQLIAKYPEVRALSEHLHEVLDPEMAEIRLKNNLSSVQMVPLVNTRKSRTRRILITSAAAACFICVLAMVLYNSKKSNTDIPPFSTLFISEGRTIALNGEQVEISANNEIIFNNRKFPVKGTSASITVPPGGKKYKVILSDGSVLHMDAASKMDFPMKFAAGKREITYEGEAYVVVKKDAANPFIMHLHDIDIKVSGTSFNVKAYAKETSSVSLLTGNIKVFHGNDSVLLKAGESASYANNSIQVGGFDSLQVLGWMNGMIIIERASIDDVEKVAARYFRITLKIDPSLKDKHIMLSFDRNRSVNDFLRQCATAYTRSYEFKDNVYYFK